MTRGGVFEGVRVIELAQYVFVPGAGALLADQGAEVIKIEPPRGDPYRSLKVGDGREIGSVNLALELNNRGKKSVALDLKTDAGREALMKLVETADVFMTSLRPQAIEKLGLTVDELRRRNPRIVYVRGNGLGFRGPEAGKAGYDASAFWARGGFGHVLTRPDAAAPTRARPAMGDHIGATSIAFGIAAALFRRAMSGEAPVVETSLLQNAAWALSADITVSKATGLDPLSEMAGDSRFPLLQAYRTRDGRWIQIMLIDPEPHWANLCELIGKAELRDDPRFCDAAARLENGPALAAEIDSRIAARDWAEWRPLFEAWDAPWELIQTLADVPDDPQVVANHLMFGIEAKDGTPVALVAGPVTFDGQAGPLAPRRAPLLAEDAYELLGSVGYSEAEIAQLTGTS